MRRVSKIVGVLLWGSLRFVGMIVLVFWRPGSSFSQSIGQFMVWMFQNLGGAYIKIGQILATRTDLISEQIALSLCALHDSVPSFSGTQAEAILQRSLCVPVSECFSAFDRIPIGSAAIAQVHRGVLRRGGIVAIKIRRPGIQRIIEIDAAIFRLFMRILAVFPGFHGLPLNDMARAITETLSTQANFRIERDRHLEFFEFFNDTGPVRVPRLLEEYCTDEILVMEYIANSTKITEFASSARTGRNAVLSGLQALYRMLFLQGLIHCDLHPGNILVGEYGNVYILDFGFAAKMGIEERRAFAEFFLAIALGDGEGASNILLETATSIPPTLNRKQFSNEISDLIKKCAGLRAADFLIVSFVTRLFRIQKAHKICASSRFTMAIISLLVYEGMIRKYYADLDFQREALPVLLRALE